MDRELGRRSGPLARKPDYVSSDPQANTPLDPSSSSRFFHSFNVFRTSIERISTPGRTAFAALTPNARGAVWVVVAGFFFTLMTALIKEIGDTIPVVQILMFRQITMTCTVLPVLISGYPGILKTNHVTLHLARVCMAVIAMTCGFTAFVHLPLAEATALSFAKSLFVTLLALVFLHEVAGPRRWFAVLLGFVGVLVMVKPDANGFNMYSLLAVAGAAAAATVMVIIRKVSQYDRPVTILSYQAIMVGIIMIVPTAYYWVTPTLKEWGIMFAIGLLSVVGQLCNIQGFKEGEASAVAPMDYSRLVFATIIGFVIFLELPDVTTLVGAALICATSFYTVRAEQRAARIRRAAADKE
ncbi:DMT family transporter [Thalassobaculum salexigens]|uniref:DMT family transporter n=1 Tax=Thalassobaculum salexigens TaxID=455360 RepID=UPI000A002973|nr:DMT family transporter [Thalassobaculum salexigens]